jgi:hypothetical protein
MTSKQKAISQTLKEAKKYGYYAPIYLDGFNDALKQVVKELKKKTNPDSWGAFALPTVEEIIMRLKDDK